MSTNASTMTRSVHIDAELLRRAEAVAADRNMPLEAYLERLLRVVTQPPPTENELTPIVRRLSGILPPMTDAEVKDAIAGALAEKYGLEDLR